MSPLAMLLILVGVLLAVVGFKDKQETLLSAVTGKTVGKSTLK